MLVVSHIDFRKHQEGVTSCLEKNYYSPSHDPPGHRIVLMQSFISTLLESSLELFLFNYVKYLVLSTELILDQICRIS